LIDVVLPYHSSPAFETILSQFVHSPLVHEIWILHDGSFKGDRKKCNSVKSDSFGSRAALNEVLGKVRAEYLLVFSRAGEIILSDSSLERLVYVLHETGAGMTYSDYDTLGKGTRHHHPVNDYQFGSIRDNFDFGLLQLYSVKAVQETVRKYGPLPDVWHAGLYDLRLRVSVDRRLFHVQEYLYTIVESDTRTSGEKQFDYVDPRNQEVQKEMERVATDHLKRIGAYLSPQFKALPKASGSFPVEVSVIIPVRNRERTIADAIGSVLRQKTDKPFNLIVVDNHSKDRTTSIVADLAKRDPRVIHLIPERDDLGIGGCWNEGVRSERCGRYAVQLDSDDMYSDENTLQSVIETFRSGEYAMVIGSYKLVNMQLEEIPPGIIDHKEWTPENGRNNALRINGLGAPRAFLTQLLRENPIPNVSYGEDYAIALRLSREYRIGRIYVPIYLCRRWEGNTDAALPVEQVNRNDSYKDKLRTIEILARQSMNARKSAGPQS